MWVSRLPFLIGRTIRETSCATLTTTYKIAPTPISGIIERKTAQMAWYRRLSFWFWTPIGILLIGIWFHNLHASWERAIVLISLLFALLFFCFILEGIEIAYTVLQARDELELESTEDFAKSFARLKEIKPSPELFYDAREWWILAIIAALTVMSDFDHFAIYFPGVAFLGLPAWDFVPKDHLLTVVKLAFSILFTTVITLWIAQSPAKVIARDNPVAFFQATSWLWAGIRPWGNFLNMLGIPSPSDGIIALVRTARPRLREEVDSRYAENQYRESLQSHGYGLHEYGEDIEIFKDGSCSRKFQAIYLIQNGKLDNFVRTFSFDSSIIDLTWTRKEVYIVPKKAGRIDPLGTGLSALLYAVVLPSGFERTEIGVVIPPPAYTPDRKKCTVTMTASDELTSGLALVLEGVVTATAGAFKLPATIGQVEENWGRENPQPVGLYSLSIRLAKDVDPTVVFGKVKTTVSTNGSVPAETTNFLSLDPTQRTLRGRLQFPGINTIYRSDWAITRTR